MDENELWDHAEEIFAQWCEGGGDPGHKPTFDRLTASHPRYAIMLKRIREQDQKLRAVADGLGAGFGGVGSGKGGELDPEATALDDEASGSAGVSQSDRSRAMKALSKVRRRKQSIGKYHITWAVDDWGSLGAGGAGAVHRAWDEDLERQVALKLLHEKYVVPNAFVDEASQERAQGRFLKEARTTAQLDHPNILPIHDFGVGSSGQPYFTMKLVKGRSLAEVIVRMHSSDSPWTLIRTLGSFLKACEAISYAHDKGVIHRDLKPANIMVGEFGAVYVVDWGLVRRVDRGAGDPGSRGGGSPGGLGEETGEAALTLDHQVVGTPLYMAPEQALGEQDRVGTWSDVYGLGAILYHILAGRAPFKDAKGKAKASEVLGALKSGRGPDPIGSLAPKAPFALRAVVTKAMALAPEDRYASVGELMGDIVAFIEGRVGSAWSSNPVMVAGLWIKRRPLLAALGLACAVMFVFLVRSSRAASRMEQSSIDRQEITELVEGLRPGTVTPELAGLLKDAIEGPAAERSGAVAELVKVLALELGQEDLLEEIDRPGPR